MFCSSISVCPNEQKETEAFKISEIYLLPAQHFLCGQKRLCDDDVINSRNWSRISVDNSAVSLLPRLWVGPMFSPISDLLE
jgi:hypothetical protein